jgi:copper chaperone CopZ
MTKQYFFRVNGMDNSTCEEKIEKIVRNIKGIEFVEADYESSMVIVKGSASSAEVTDVINAQGYNAILVAE